MSLTAKQATGSLPTARTKIGVHLCECYRPLVILRVPASPFPMQICRREQISFRLMVIWKIHGHSKLVLISIAMQEFLKKACGDSHRPNFDLNLHLQLLHNVSRVPRSFNFMVFLEESPEKFRPNLDSAFQSSSCLPLSSPGPPSVSKQILGHKIVEAKR